MIKEKPYHTKKWRTQTTKANLNYAESFVSVPVVEGFAALTTEQQQAIETRVQAGESAEDILSFNPITDFDTLSDAQFKILHNAIDMMCVAYAQEQAEAIAEEESTWREQEAYYASSRGVR